MPAAFVLAFIMCPRSKRLAGPYCARRVEVPYCCGFWPATTSVKISSQTTTCCRWFVIISRFPPCVFARCGLDGIGFVPGRFHSRNGHSGRRSRVTEIGGRAPLRSNPYGRAVRRAEEGTAERQTRCVSSVPLLVWPLVPCYLLCYSALG